jgi:hypothetical protein
MADRNTRNPLRYGVMAVGLFYLVLAFAGFMAISDNTNVGGDLYGGNPPDLLWGAFGVSTVMNFIHLVLGAFTLIAGVVVDRSQIVAWSVTIGFALLFCYGVISILVRTGTDPLAVNWADNWLHLVTVVALGAMTALTQAAAPKRERQRVP